MEGYIARKQLPVSQEGGPTPEPNHAVTLILVFQSSEL
jgi:hypothetical protein